MYGAAGYRVMYAGDENIVSGCEYRRVVKSNSEKNRFKPVDFTVSAWRLRLRGHSRPNG